MTRRELLIGATTAPALLLGSSTVGTAPTTSSAAFPDIGVSNFNMKAHSPEKFVEMIEGLGAQFVRCDLAYWSQTEVTKGHLAPSQTEASLYPTLRRAGIGIVPLLMYGNANYAGSGDWHAPPRDLESIQAFGRYAAYVATQMSDALGYEIWNEPNNPPFWTSPDPRAYAAVLDEGTRAILEAKPNARVFSAGIGYCGGAWGNPGAYMKAVVDASRPVGQIRRLSAHGIHPYPAHGSSHTETPEEMLEAFIPKYRQAISYNGDLAITECGYSGKWLQFDDEIMAHYTARLLCAAVANRVSLYSHYCLIDAGLDTAEEHNSFGLFRADRSPKPAAKAFRAVTDALAGARTWSYRSVGPVRELALEKAQGRVSIAWNTGRSDVAGFVPLVTQLEDVRDVLGRGVRVVGGGARPSIVVPASGAVHICSGT